MAYYEDLTPYNYHHRGERELNIGWLKQGQSFTIGDIPEGFIEKLKIYLQSEFTILDCLGDHDCEFCDKQESACCEIRVVSSDGKIYACPELILHYIEDHKYLPPQEFIDAVMSGPTPGSKEYKNIITRLPESWQRREPDLNDVDYQDKVKQQMVDEMSKCIDEQIISELLRENPEFGKFMQAYNKIMPSVYNVSNKKEKS